MAIELVTIKNQIIYKLKTKDKSNQNYYVLSISTNKKIVEFKT